MQSYYKRGGDMMILTLQVMRYFADIFETMHSDKQVFLTATEKETNVTVQLSSFLPMA